MGQFAKKLKICIRASQFLVYDRVALWLRSAQIKRLIKALTVLCAVWYSVERRLIGKVAKDNKVL
jgi:hypothetical protein